jgi:hypothetical protein
MTDQSYGYGAGQYQQAANGDWNQAWAGYEQQSADPNAYYYQQQTQQTQGQQTQQPTYGAQNYGTQPAGSDNISSQSYDSASYYQGASQDANQYSQQGAGVAAGQTEEEAEYSYSDAPNAYPDARPDLVDQDAPDEASRPSLAASLNFDENDNEKNLIRDAEGRPKAASFAKLISLITHPKEPGMFHSEIFSSMPDSCGQGHKIRFFGFEFLVRSRKIV